MLNFIVAKSSLQFPHCIANDVTKTRNGEWEMGNGECGMGNSPFIIPHSLWEMENGEWEMGNGQRGIGNRKLLRLLLMIVVLRQNKGICR